MIYCFDLDDTLYKELDFVIGGFKNVSNFLEEKFSIPSEKSYQKMCSILKSEGRGKVFNQILEEYSICKKSYIDECIQKYRYHEPDIELFSDSFNFLKSKKKEKLYIITDGNKIVQRRKFYALGLDHFIKKILPTYQYGRDKSKPSTYCFEKICQYEKIPPKKLIYFGDNTKKDFLNIKKIGIKTIQILRGPYVDLGLPQEYQAEFRINSFDDFEAIENTYLKGD